MQPRGVAVATRLAELAELRNKGALVGLALLAAGLALLALFLFLFLARDLVAAGWRTWWAWTTSKAPSAWSRA